MTADFNPQLAMTGIHLVYRYSERGFSLRATSGISRVQTVDVIEMGQEGCLLRRSLFNPALPFDELVEHGREIIATFLEREDRNQGDDDEELD